MARRKPLRSPDHEAAGILVAPPPLDHPPRPTPHRASGGYDIGGIAEDHGTTAIPFIDDRMLDENGALKDLDPAMTKARENVVRLGNAAADAVADRTIREAGEHHAAATRKQTEYVGLETQLIAATRGQTQSAQLEMWAAAMRHSTRPKYSKLMALAAKPLFLLGDTSVIGGMLYLTGAPVLTAVATGVSAATGAVFAGSTAGHNAAVAYQRRRRGPMPEGCPEALADLYEDPLSNDTPGSLWLSGAIVYAVALSLGVVLVGVGTGVAAIEAMGNGLLTMLTVAGSGFAEAYSTNEATDRLEKLQKLRSGYDGDARSINELHADAQEELVRAGTVRSAGSREASAAMNTTIVVSDPTTHDPRTFGYQSPMPAESTRVELRAHLPEQVPPPELTGPGLARSHAPMDVIGDINRSFAAAPVPGAAQPQPATATMNAADAEEISHDLTPTRTTEQEDQHDDADASVGVEPNSHSQLAGTVAPTAVAGNDYSQNGHREAQP